MPQPLINTERLFSRLRWVLNRQLVVFFFVLLGLYSSREVVDLDLWLHLKTGQIIAATHKVPLADIFSFVLQGKEWINHEWLFQFGAHLFYQQGGADALIFMQNMVALALFLVLFFAGLRKENHLFVFSILYLALLTVAYRFTIRPDIFSLLFLAIDLVLIASFLDSGHRAIWCLPILQCLWTNMHGFAFAGPLILLLVLVADVVKKIGPWSAVRKNDALDPSRVRQLILLILLMFLASFVNPQGLKGAAYPFSVLGQISGKGRIFFDYIQELARPITRRNIADFHIFLEYKVLILVSLFSFRFNSRRPDVWAFLLWVFFLFFSLLAIRNVAYFGVVAAFVIFRNVRLALDHGKKLPPLLTHKKLTSWGYGVCLALCIYYPAQAGQKYLTMTQYNFKTFDARGILWGVAENRYPNEAADFLLHEPFPKRIFNDFNSGAYLIGRVYPERQVYIDGRTELYGPDFFEAYVKLCRGHARTIQDAIRRYDLQGFFLTNPDKDIHVGLLRYLGRSREWVPVYFDEAAIIFLKKSPENKKLIDRFGMDLGRWSPPQTKLMKIGIAGPYPYPYVNRGRLLSNLNFHKAAAKEALAALEIMPNCSEAFRILMESSYAEKKFWDAYRYARLCLLYDRQNVSARLKLALIYQQLGFDKKAIDTVDTLIKQLPRAGQAYYTKALILGKTSLPESIRLLRQAVILDPRHTQAWEALGDLLTITGNKEGAQNAYKTAFSYDASNDALRKKSEA